MGRDKHMKEKIARAIANHLLSKGNEQGSVVEWKEIDEWAETSRGRFITFKQFSDAVKAAELLSDKRAIQSRWDDMVAIGAIRPSNGPGVSHVLILSVIKGLVPELSVIQFEGGAHTLTHNTQEGKA